MSGVRIVFMGTPDLAATCLTRLLDQREIEVAAVVSQPDRPKGRRLQLQPTPVKQLAIDAGLTVWQPAKAREPGFLADLRKLGPALIVVAAFILARRASR